MRLEWAANQIKYGNAPIRGSLAFGTAQDPYYLPVKVPIRPGDQIKATAYNDSAFTLKGQLVFRCEASKAA